MTDSDREQLKERVIDVLKDDGVVLENPNLIAAHIIAAIEWSHYIISFDEWEDVRDMANHIELMDTIVQEWGWLR